MSSPVPERSHGDPAPAPDPLPVPVVDNHTHLDIHRPDLPSPLRSSAEEPLLGALQVAASVGVDRVVQVGCDLESARWTVSILDEHPAVLGAVALHPNEAPVLADAGRLDEALAEIEELARHPRVRAIGETGLDYYRTGEGGRAAQQESFRRHIRLARSAGKALQIHNRDSHEDVLRILAEEGAPERTVLHCFSGDVAMARECVERGYYLSFAGTVTFKNARGLRDALAVTPLEQVLVEGEGVVLLLHLLLRRQERAGDHQELLAAAQAVLLFFRVQGAAGLAEHGRGEPR